MKSFSLIPLLLLMVVICGSAFAYTGILPTDNTPVPVQNVRGISPVPVAASCITVTKTKGSLGSFSTQDTTGKYYLMMSWTATDPSGTPTIVKRALNSNTAYQPGSSGEITLNHGIQTVSFSGYSTANPGRTYNICVDRQ
jgi:hypothetical protein